MDSSDLQSPGKARAYSQEHRRAMAVTGVALLLLLPVAAGAPVTRLAADKRVRTEVWHPLGGSDASHPAQRHVGHWSANPSKCPSSMVTDAPIIGNGELGAAVSGALPLAGEGGMQQSFYLGQMDFWTEQAIGAPPGWTHVAPGHATLSFVPQNLAWPSDSESGPRIAYNATQELYAARANTTVTLSDQSWRSPFVVSTSSIVAKDDAAGDTNALLTRIKLSHDATVGVQLSTDNMYGLPIQAGASAQDVLWLHRHATKWVHNTAVLTECSALSLNVGLTKVFALDLATGLLGPLQNATSTAAGDLPQCMWLASDADEPQLHQPRNTSGLITMGDCGRRGTRWHYDAGTKQLKSLDFPETCVCYHCDTVEAYDAVVVPCPCEAPGPPPTPPPPSPPPSPAQPAVFDRGRHGASVSISADGKLASWSGAGAKCVAATGTCQAALLTNPYWVVRGPEAYGGDADVGLCESTVDVASGEWIGWQTGKSWLYRAGGRFKGDDGGNSTVCPFEQCGKPYGKPFGVNANITTIVHSRNVIEFLLDGESQGRITLSSSLPATGLVGCVASCSGATMSLNAKPSHKPSTRKCGASQSPGPGVKWTVANASFQGVTGVTLTADFGEPSAVPFSVGPQCLGIVRDNINISLGMAAALSSASAEEPLILPFNVSSLAVANSDPWAAGCVYGTAKCPNSYSASASYALKAGVEYMLRVSVQTTRGGNARTSALKAAVTEARSLSTINAEATHAEQWRLWWNKSSVDLGQRRSSKPSSLEGFYYGAQYMLNSFSKSQGGVIPGLLGPWSLQDPVGWADGITMDYNAEANYYGAASSNHPEAMHPYFPTVSAAVSMGRQRAALPDWSFGGHEAAVPGFGVGTTGDQTDAMGCACAGMLGYPWCRTDIHNRTCPAGFGGFEGIEFPLQLGGFATMHSSPDGAMRSVAAMAAAPFVEYFEHTQNVTFLRRQAYPFLREVALFYASYLRLNPSSGRYEVPHACAQEFCGERQLPSVPIPGGHGCPQPPQSSPTIDLAFAEYLLEKSADWSELLGVDAERRAQWRSIAASLAPYPLAQHHDCAKLFPWAEATNCTGWAEATNTDTNTSAELHANYNWPIANFAPIHPTGRVSLSSDNATKLLARNTAWMLATDSSWAPENGLCLAWPSAARMADRFEPYPFGASVLMDAWEAALASHMNPNFWPSLGGGGLEQAGATLAVNELLMQSFEGFLRFFPGWPLGEPACFTTLRAVGAFLVSGCVDETGDIKNLIVLSEAGKPCEFVPFSMAPNVTVVWNNKGRKVPLERVEGCGRLRFQTVAGEHYALDSSAPV